MKKLLALTAALALLAACMPVFAFTGFDADPGLPAVTAAEEPFFPVELHRVENEPLEEENDWGDTVYTWNYMEDDAAIAVGDTVTMSVEFSVPAELTGFGEEALNSIAASFKFTGVDGLEVVMAYGCDVNIECDYDAGYCFPLDGYGNVSVEGDTLNVDAHLNTEVRIIVRGTATEEKVACDNTVVIGQCSLPTHFSVGTLKKVDGAYYVYFKDVMAVQIRGMKFMAEDGLFAGYYVCLNDHDYIRNEDGSAFTSVEDPEVEITEGVRFEALTDAYNTYMEFFGFTDDDVRDVLTDGVFLNGREAASFTEGFVLGGGEPDNPPAPVTPPATGGMSLAVLGVIAIVTGAGVALFGKRR